MERRLQQYLQQGRRLLLLGDLNISPEPADMAAMALDCNSSSSSSRAALAEFVGRPDRVWLSRLLCGGGGALVDTYRLFHKDT